MKKYANLIIAGAPIWLVLYFYIPLKVRELIFNQILFQLFLFFYVALSIFIGFYAWRKKKKNKG